MCKRVVKCWLDYAKLIHDDLPCRKLFILVDKYMFQVSNIKSTRKKIWNMFKVNKKDARTMSLTMLTLDIFHMCWSVLIFDFEQVDVNWDCFSLCLIPMTVSKILSFPVFHQFFCGIFWKYKLEKKILVFDVFLFEEKFTCWKSPDWLLSGRSSLLSNLVNIGFH